MILIKIFYSIAVNLRNFFYDKKILPSYKSSIPVISIGNITVGGTGKTPFVIFLAAYLKDRGDNPLIISRGYKRQGTKQILLTTGHPYSVKEMGDEPSLMRQLCNNVDILIDANRVAAVKWAEKQNKKYNYIILDDAFQHRAISRDFNILLINPQQNMGSYPPQGELREPFKNIKRADCVVLTKGKQDNALTSLIESYNLPILETAIDFTISDNDQKRGVSFCGIADSNFFIQTLSHFSIKTRDHLNFKDHQEYNDLIIEKIERILIKNKERTFFTTRKDWVKLPKYFLKKYRGICIDMFLSIKKGTNQSKFEELLLKHINK